jgi:RES domain-containing protein
VTAQVLGRTLSSYRIGDPNGAYPIFDATGSTIAPGRWNTPGSPVIYSSEHYSTALLEKLVHGSGRLPPNQHYVRIVIPRGTSYEVFSPPALPGWDRMPATVSRKFGERWCAEKRSAILLVPSVIARLDNNILINPAHPEFAGLEPSLHEPVFWDRRLFGQRVATKPRK